MYEQLNIFDLTLQKFQIEKPIRLIELFAGIGSQAMALRDLGAEFEHYRVVETDKYAIKSYNAIHGTEFSTMDIRKVRGEDLGIYDTDKYCYIMTYSFPCQDLSVAGKRKGMEKDSGTRSGLLWEVERLLNESSDLPQVLLMENVPQVHSEKNMPDFQKWIDILTSKGYSNYWKDLNAKDYGVAQNRDRTFMVSILGEYNYRFPLPIPLTKTMNNYLEDKVDEKYYINTERAQQLIDKLISNGDIKKQKDFIMDGNFNQRGKVHREDGICRTILGSGHSGNEPKVLTLGTIYTEVSDCFQKGIYPIARCLKAEKHDLGIVEASVKQIGNISDGGNWDNPQAGRVYASYGLCPTINTCQGGQREPKTIVAMHGRNPQNPSNRTAGSPTEQRLETNAQGLCNTLTGVQKDNLVMEINTNYRIRKLIPLECWRLMGFSDDDFKKAESINSNAQLYKQAGNSIVKDVLIMIFQQMMHDD